jgi:broad specificity phosphatase PhoE
MNVRIFLLDILTNINYPRRKKKENYMRELIFIRHGQASFGRGDYDILSERGREQAFLVAQYLLNTGVLFDRAYSGTLQRQVGTAEVVLDHLRANTVSTPPLRQIKELNEYQFERIMSHYVPLVAQEDAARTCHYRHFSF